MLPRSHECAKVGSGIPLAVRQPFHGDLHILDELDFVRPEGELVENRRKFPTEIVVEALGLQRTGKGAGAGRCKPIPGDLERLAGVASVVADVLAGDVVTEFLVSVGIAVED